MAKGDTPSGIPNQNKYPAPSPPPGGWNWEGTPVNMNNANMQPNRQMQPDNNPSLPNRTDMGPGGMGNGMGTFTPYAGSNQGHQPYDPFMNLGPNGQFQFPNSGINKMPVGPAWSQGTDKSIYLGNPNAATDQGSYGGYPTQYQGQPYNPQQNNLQNILKQLMGNNPGIMAPGVNNQSYSNPGLMGTLFGMHGGLI